MNPVPSTGVQLFIPGTGLLGEEFFALVEDMQVEVEALVENLDRRKEGNTLCGRPVISVDQVPTGARCVCALSTTKRKMYVEQVQDRAEFVNTSSTRAARCSRGRRVGPAQSSRRAGWSRTTRPSGVVSF